MALDLGAIKARYGGLYNAFGVMYSFTSTEPVHTLLERDIPALIARVEELEAERDAARLARDLFQRQEADAIRYWQQAQAERDEWHKEAFEWMHMTGELTKRWNSVQAERDALEAENERLKEVWSELCVMRREYGDADDHSLTRDAIDLKRAICRVWDELELHAEGFATLADPTRRDDCECLLSRKLRGHVDQG